MRFDSDLSVTLDHCWEISIKPKSHYEASAELSFVWMDLFWVNLRGESVFSLRSASGVWDGSRLRKWNQNLIFEPETCESIRLRGAGSDARLGSDPNVSRILKRKNTKLLPKIHLFYVALLFQKCFICSCFRQISLWQWKVNWIY